MNLLITFVFWAFLYSDISGKLTGGRLIETFTSHILPFLVSQADFWVNGWMFKYSHLIFVLIFATIYMLVNMIACLSLGYALYPIITWKDWKTGVFVPGLYLLIIGSFYLFTYISQRRNRKAGSNLEYLGKEKEQLTDADMFLNSSDTTKNISK